EVRVGADVEAGQEMIGAGKNRAKVERRGTLCEPRRAIVVNFHRVSKRVVLRRRELRGVARNRESALVVDRRNQIVRCKIRLDRLVGVCADYLASTDVEGAA